MSNGLDADQDRHYVGPDLGPNCLQRLSAEDKVAANKERVKLIHSVLWIKNSVDPDQQASSEAS